MQKLSARPIGGLGNQLFIIARGYKLARDRGMELVIDTSRWYAGQGEPPETYKDTLYKNFTFGKGHPIKKGYYQSEKYFEPYGREFVGLLDIDLQPVNKVAVHIRRGDYLKLHKHNVCDLDYYKRAMEGYNNITIFSDDPSWCRKTFPDIEVFEGAVLDSFRYMASHRIVICSNSSFSWWASYIGDCKTIVPDRWYNGKEDEDIYREGMIRI